MPFICFAVVFLFLMNVFNHGQHTFFIETCISDSLGLLMFLFWLILELILLLFFTSCYQYVPFVDCGRTTQIHCVWVWLHIIHFVLNSVNTSMLSLHGLIALVPDCAETAVTQRPWCRLWCSLWALYMIGFPFSKYSPIQVIYSAQAYSQGSFHHKLLCSPFLSAFIYFLVTFCSCHSASALHVNSPHITDA